MCLFICEIAAEAFALGNLSLWQRIQISWLYLWILSWLDEIGVVSMAKHLIYRLVKKIIILCWTK